MKPARLLLAAPVLAALLVPTAAPSSAGAVPTPVDGVWPLHPRPPVVNGFDPPSVAWGRGHRGVDLAGRVGQPVRAAAAGQVTFAGRIAGVGTVVVGHGTTRTTYQPVDPSVSRGARVAAGDRLGELEWHGTHCSPAACLHWGLLEGERYLDPLTLVGAPGPVRLLPDRAVSEPLLAAAPLGWPPAVVMLAGAPAGMPAGAARW